MRKILSLSDYRKLSATGKKRVKALAKRKSNKRSKRRRRY